MSIVFLNKLYTISRLAAVTAVLGAAAATPVFAQDSSVSLDLNDDAVRLSWQQFRPERQFSFEASAFNHQDRGTIATVGFHITGNAATKARPISAGLGGRLVYADAERIAGTGVIVDPALDPLSVPGNGIIATGISSQNGYALAVGGFFRGQIPNYDRIGFGGHLYFAPDVLAFGDMEEFSDLWLYGSYSVLRNGDLYIGARSLKADFKGRGDYNFDTGLHAGFTLKF